MFGIGDQELVLIILFAFLLFGPDKLPGMGRTIGRALRQFRTASEGVTKVVQSEIIDPIQNAADTPAGKAAAKAQEEDADLTPAETFAERRARLAAEKAAAEKGKDAEQGAQPAADPDSDEDAGAEPQATPEPEADLEPAPTSVAALYGLDDEDDDDEEDA